MVFGCLGEEAQFIGQIKAALDIDWFDPDDKASALMDLLEDIQKVCQWLMTQLEPLVQNDEITQIYTNLTKKLHIY